MKKLGQIGEGIAVSFLEEKGYRIIERNFRNAFGEIDIIAWDNNVLSFVEVKTRESVEFGLPFESVHQVKKRKIARVALSYLKRFEELPQCRFDVLSICLRGNMPQCELIQDAFEV